MLTALLLTLLVAGLLSVTVRWKPKLLAPVCDSLALALVLNKLVSLGHFATHEEEPWHELLPLHLCDWATFTGVIALVTRRPLAFELTWFWAMAGTTQALVTPDLAVRPPELSWYTFYLSHGGVVAAALLLTWGAGLRTRHWAAFRIFASSCAISSLRSRSVIRTPSARFISAVSVEISIRSRTLLTIVCGTI